MSGEIDIAMVRTITATGVVPAQLGLTPAEQPKVW